MAQIKKNPVSGKTVKTTTYNLLTPFKRNEKMVNERTTRKPAPKKPAVKRPDVKPAPLPTKSKPKPKPRVVQMPSKISPSKMTPAQKAKYLQNPERYDK